MNSTIRPRQTTKALLISAVLILMLWSTRVEAESAQVLTAAEKSELPLAQSFDTGAKLFRNQDYELAIKHLDRALEAKATDKGKAHGLLGICHLQLEEYDEAETHLRKAIRLETDNRKWKICLLTVLSAQGRMTEAKDLLEELTLHNMIAL